MRKRIVPIAFDGAFQSLPRFFIPAALEVRSSKICQYACANPVGNGIIGINVGRPSKVSDCIFGTAGLERVTTSLNIAANTGATPDEQQGQQYECGTTLSHHIYLCPLFCMTA